MNISMINHVSVKVVSLNMFFLPGETESVLGLCKVSHSSLVHLRRFFLSAGRSCLSLLGNLARSVELHGCNFRRPTRSFSWCLQCFRRVPVRASAAASLSSGDWNNNSVPLSSSKNAGQHSALTYVVF